MSLLNSSKERGKYFISAFYLFVFVLILASSIQTAYASNSRSDEAACSAGFTCGTCPHSLGSTCGAADNECCCNEGCTCNCDDDQCTTNSGWDAECPSAAICGCAAPTATPTPTPAVPCTVGFDNPRESVYVGDTQSFLVTINDPTGTITQVNFSLDNPGVAFNLLDAMDDVAPYDARIQANLTSGLSDRLNAEVIIDGAFGCSTSGEYLVFECPLIPDVDREIVIFADEYSEKLSCTLDPGDTYAADCPNIVNTPTAVDIDAGRYMITLVNHDAHSIGEGSAEQGEQYYLNLYNASGVLNGTTLQSDDLPDGSDYNQTVVEAVIDITTDVASIVPWLYNSEAVTDEFSVIPVCAAFDLLSIPECIIDLIPDTITFSGTGTTQTMSASPTHEEIQVVETIEYTTSDVGVVAVCDPILASCPDGSDSYTVTDVHLGSSTSFNVTSKSLGPATITAYGTMTCPYCTCSDTSTVSVADPDPWWQAEGGNVMVGWSGSGSGPNASITANFPGDSCTNEPLLCTPYLILGESPGVAIAEGTISVTLGSVSEEGWVVSGTEYIGDMKGYEYYRNKLPNSVNPVDLSTLCVVVGTDCLIDQADLTSGGTEYPTGSNNFYYEFNSTSTSLLIDESTTHEINLQYPSPYRNVIIFTRDRPVVIGSDIKSSEGQGGLVLFSEGDIQITENVAEISGMYVTDNDFYSTDNSGGVAPTPLMVTGSLVVWGDVDMGRDLADNSLTPAEVFRFSFGHLMRFPETMKDQPVRWKEVAP